MRLYFIIGLFGLIAAIAAACGGASPTPTPTSTPTPVPTSTGIPTPVSTPTPVLQSSTIPKPIGTVTREHLPGMVLDQADIRAEFREAALEPEASGYWDNEVAADDTIDPGDTAADLAARGHLDRYEHSFSDLLALMFGAPSEGRPFLVEAIVDLFDGQPSAQALLQRQVQDFRRFQGIEIKGFQGIEIEGLTLEVFEELVAPDLGTDAVSGRFLVTAGGAKAKPYATFVSWVRGPVVALVRVAAHDDADLSAAVNRLALRMDQRIDEVLAGGIAAAPVVRAATAAALEEAARSEGFDLPAMLPTLADLPDGATIESEVFDVVKYSYGDIGAYIREFGAGGAVVQLGSSQSIKIVAKVELHATDLDSRAELLDLKGLDPAVLGELYGYYMAGVFPDTIAVEAVKLAEMGDAAAGFLMTMKTEIGDFDAYLLFFARGRIAANLFVMGLGDQVHLEDVILLAQLLDARIQENSP